MIIPGIYGSTRRIRLGSAIDIAHEIYDNPEAPWHCGKNTTEPFCNFIIHLSGDVLYSTATSADKGSFLDIFTAGPYELYSINWDRKSPYERIAIYFDYDVFDKFFLGDEDSRKAYLSFLDRRKNGNILRLHENYKEELLSFIKKFDNILDTNDFQTTFKAISTITAFFEFMYKATNSLQIGNESFKRSTTKDALKYIDNNFITISTITDVANALKIAPVYLSKTFEEDMQINLKAYIHSKKLLYAKKLIKSGANVTEAALDSGFNNISYFIKLYKEKFGYTPKKTNR